MLVSKVQKIVIWLMAFSMATGVKAQSYDSQRSAVFAVNILSNALIGGIGGAINRNKEEKFCKAFCRNFLKGGIGGLVKYSAKQQLYYLSDENKLFYAPINRMYYFLGHSMVMNAAYDRKLLDRYYCNLLGIDIRFNPRAEQKLQARLSLSTLCNAAIFGGLAGGELNIYKSLELGVLYFDGRKNPLALDYSGVAGFNCVMVRVLPGNIPYGGAVLPHEITHIYQKYDLFGISSFYDKKITERLRERKLIRLLSRYVIADYESIFATIAYHLQPKPAHYRNYYEFEAEHFATRAYVPR